MTPYATYAQIHHERSQLVAAECSHWIHTELFTLNWWLLFILLFIPWLVWRKAVDRRRQLEIFCYGLLIGLVSLILDTVGTTVQLWGYRVELAPVAPLLLPADVSVVPVAFMLIYQHWRTLKKFLFANIILSATFSFIAEPLFIWLGIYTMHTWHHVYSFVIYILMGTSLRGLFLRFVRH